MYRSRLQIHTRTLAIDTCAGHMTLTEAYTHNIRNKPGRTNAIIGKKKKIGKNIRVEEKMQRHTENCIHSCIEKN